MVDLNCLDQELHTKTINLVKRLENEDRLKEAKLVMAFYLANYYRTEAMKKYLEYNNKIIKLLKV